MIRALLAAVIIGTGLVYALSYDYASSNPTDPQSVEFFKSLADVRSAASGLLSVLKH